MFFSIMTLMTFPCHYARAGDILVVAMEHNKFLPQHIKLREEPGVSLLGDTRDLLLTSNV